MRLGNLARLARNRLHNVRSLSVPAPLVAKQASLIDPEGLRQSLLKNYFVNDLASLETAEGKTDFDDHFLGRLERARLEVVTWVNEFRPIQGARVLEIGCGTGSSMVAFSEQGADVIAIDVDAPSVAVARDRLSAHKLAADVRVTGDLPEGSYDIILMFAVLEHMTLEERLRALKDAWNYLRPGGVLVTVETPNRLWYHDWHTAMANFFLWLPDDLATLYADRTPREGYVNGSSPVELARWGRGVSFHDFEVAWDMECSTLPIVSSMTHWIRQRTNTGKIGKSGLDQRWERTLKEVHPAAHEGFCTHSLDLIFRKPG